MLLFIVLVVASISLVGVLLLLCPGKRPKHACGNTQLAHRRHRIWITMTTLPERLMTQWFSDTLTGTIARCSRLGATLLLQVPVHTKKKQPYTVPLRISNMQNETFRVNRVPEDEGPITKILPALRDSDIGDDDTVIVCDDDIVYRRNVFQLLVNSVEKHPSAVSCMCHKRIEGFKGFAFRKRVLQDLVRIHRPSSCYRIDDDVLVEFARHRKIKTVAVPYNQDSTQDYGWTCSMHQKETDTHPPWLELGSDDRAPLVQQCVSELHRENKWPPPKKK
jgi:hypothetical protein